MAKEGGDGDDCGRYPDHILMSNNYSICPCAHDMRLLLSLDLDSLPRAQGPCIKPSPQHGSEGSRAHDTFV